MDEMIYDGLVALTKAVERQNELQEEANAIGKALIAVTADNSQELLDLREYLKSTAPKKRVPGGIASAHRAPRVRKMVISG